MDAFNAELNRVLRYSMEPVANMVQQLASDSHQHTRWGHPEGDHTFRLVLADALQEQDRHKEAHLLRTEGQHVLVDGEVRRQTGKTGIRSYGPSR